MELIGDQLVIEPTYTSNVPIALFTNHGNMIVFGFLISGEANNGDSKEVTNTRSN
jgi:hypothetical protein